MGFFRLTFAAADHAGPIPPERSVEGNPCLVHNAAILPTGTVSEHDSFRMGIPVSPKVVRCADSAPMSIPPSIANFRITAKLGEGGMGEVYRATDTKLGHAVAIQVAEADIAARAETGRVELLPEFRLWVLVTEA